MFIVYRILYSISRQKSNTDELSGGGKTFQFTGKPAQSPPETARLIPYTGSEDPFANLADALETHGVLIDKGGLERIGDFTIDEMVGYHIRAFTHADYFLLAIIYKDPIDRVWLNLVTEYTDGRVITTSSAERGAILQSRPRGMPLFNYPAVSPEQLLRRHKLETRANDNIGSLAPEEFPEYFAKNYARVRAHVYEREEEASLPQDELGQMQSGAADQAMTETTDNTSSFTPSRAQQKHWLDKIYESNPIPREQRKQFQSSLVWILENAELEPVSHAISQYADVNIEEVDKGRLVIRTDAGVEDILDPGNLRGPALFEKINSALPEGKRFKKLRVSLGGVSFYSQMIPGT